MGTVWPSAILISFRTPAEGEGISASTLSVEISKSGSPAPPLLPGFLGPFVVGPFKDAFAHLGHDYINCHGIALLRLIQPSETYGMRGALGVFRGTFLVYSERQG